MPVVVAPGSALLALIQPEMEVTWNQGGVYYAGRIRAITPADYWRADYLTLDIECQDYTSLLNDEICTSARSVIETDAQRISWLLQSFDRRGISGRNVQTLYTNMPSQDFTGMTLTAAITTVLAFSGGGFYVDDFKDLHTFIAESLPAPFALSDNPDGATSFGYRDFKYPQDSVDLRNAIYMIPSAPFTPPTVADAFTETITTTGSPIVGFGINSAMVSFKAANNATIKRVGSMGVFTAGTTSQVTPSYGQPTKAGNFLVSPVFTTDAAPTTTTPGWVQAVLSSGNAYYNAIWFKPNCGDNEIPPTFTTTIPGGVPMFAQLLEFSGVDALGTLDWVTKLTPAAGASTMTITAGGADKSFDLVLVATEWVPTSSATATFTQSFNNGAVVHAGDSSSVARVLHYSINYSILPTAAVPTWYTNDTSIATYGRREAAITAPSTVVTQVALDALGAANVTAHAYPLKHASLLLPPGSPAGLTAGMTIPVTNSLYGLSAQPFRIQSVDTTYPADNLPQFAVQFADPIVTMTTQLGALQASIPSGIAVPASSSPLGTLNYAPVVANQTGIVGVSVDLTGLSVSVVVGSGRRIRITGYGNWGSTVSLDAAGFNIYEGAAQLQAGQVVCQVASLSCVVSVVVTPSAGAHTYKLVGVRSSGTGSLTLFASTTDPAWILVEDIGT